MNKVFDDLWKEEIEMVTSLAWGSEKKRTQLLKDIIGVVVTGMGAVCVWKFMPLWKRPLPAYILSRIDRYFMPEERVSAGLAAAWLVLVSFVFVCWTVRTIRKRARLTKSKAASLFVKAMVGMIQCQIFQYIIGETTKRLVARPRPDFIDRCYGSVVAPNASILELPVCTNTHIPAIIMDGWMSFPSQHTGFSFASAMYCASFSLTSSALASGVGTSQLILPFSVCVVSIIIGISRIADNRHHPSDVVGGMLIGAFIGVVTFHFSSAREEVLNIKRNSERKMQVLSQFTPTSNTKQEPLAKSYSEELPSIHRLLSDVQEP